ncbi:CsbD family protein [Kocuria palustris]|uniref:CsbD family protein n=1 Tax=Kocuria palustris TaxID=71999 RepID=UPI002468D70A|nr:CsbD family protein [Kocuria palustris]MDH5153017.1 CsbD family protein [Kocuria palustris]
MGLGDKISNKAEEASGHAKQKLGEATGDERLQGAGEQQENSSNLKQAGENLKDAKDNVLGDKN